MSLQIHPPANTHPASAAHASSGWTNVLRLLGALLCLGAVVAVVVTEIVAWRDTWLQQTALVRTGQCPPYPELATPLSMVLGGQHQELYLVPAIAVLLVMGARVLMGRTPGIPPTFAAWALIISAFLAYFDILSGRPSFASGPVCAILPGARSEPTYVLGLLAGLLGCVLLARTTHYRPLNLHDA